MTTMTSDNVHRLSDLHAAFVNFEAEKIEGCKIVYLNPRLAESKSAGSLLKAYSYLVKPAGEYPSRSSVTKVFKAERYGGDGILTNGGGGRCGFDGTCQLKGLGPNPLVGHDVDHSHGDGNLSLNTAIYESIWAEIVHVVLPYGAIRTVAVLDTGLEYDTWQGAKNRGLLVRQPVVRPAHFIRATYFRQKRLHALGEDAQRVKDLIHKLVDFLPGTLFTNGGDSLQERLKKGLIELTGRYAMQFATARAKQITHLNVSASNISIDGAWLDLSSTRIFTATTNCDRLTIERFKNEYLPALQSIQDLCYYLSKYEVIATEDSLSIWRTAFYHFNNTYDKHLHLQQVAQAGFPLWLLDAVQDSSEFKDFAIVLDTVLEMDDFTVTEIIEDTGWDGYARWTVRLFNALLLGYTQALKEADLSWLKTDKNNIYLLYKKYIHLFDHIIQTAAKSQITRQNLYRCIQINANRLNRTHRLLHDLETLASNFNTEAKNEYNFYHIHMEKIILAATFNLANEHATAVPFWLSRHFSIWFKPISGTFTLSGFKKCSLTLDELIEQGKENKEINRALRFHGIQTPTL